MVRECRCLAPLKTIFYMTKIPQPRLLKYRLSHHATFMSRSSRVLFHVLRDLMSCSLSVCSVVCQCDVSLIQVLVHVLQDSMSRSCRFCSVVCQCCVSLIQFLFHALRDLMSCSFRFHSMYARSSVTLLGGLSSMTSKYYCLSLEGSSSSQFSPAGSLLRKPRSLSLLTRLSFMLCYF